MLRGRTGELKKYILSMKKDYSYVEAVVRLSFWNVYKPGCDEHVMVHKLRESEEYIPELDLLTTFAG